MEAGGNLNLQNRKNFTAAHFLLQNSNMRFDRNLFALFKQYNLDFSILSPNSRSYAYIYLESGAVDTKVFAEIAAQFPQALSVKGPHPLYLDVYKATPLFFLLKSENANRTDLLDVFIQSGADLNSQDTYRQQTLLHGVMDNLIYDHSEWLPMFEMLLQAKADPDVKNSWRESVRSIAKERKRADLLELINRYSPEKAR